MHSSKSLLEKQNYLTQNNDMYKKYINKINEYVIYFESIKGVKIPINEASKEIAKLKLLAIRLAEARNELESYIFDSNQKNTESPIGEDNSTYCLVVDETPMLIKARHKAELLDKINELISENSSSVHLYELKEIQLNKKVLYII